MVQFSILVLLGAALGALLFYAVTKFILRFRLRKRFDHANLGEQAAEDILKEWGYTLESTQQVSKLSMWINGELFSYLVRPDAFAHKEDKRYLVEVKTGKNATDPKSTATRRQLLEYFHGFDVDGVLLVDADLRKVHQIHFGRKKLDYKAPFFSTRQEVSEKKLLKVWWAFILGFILALLMVFLWH